ncbi:MAG: 50S ribosomal protein L29 [Chloroflexi bacterium]|nr:50S ribosomal protein L29 [Chloroflexota bacterium]
MKPAELRELNTDELRRQLDEAYHELFNLRFRKATRQLDNTAAVGKARREIARIRTIVRERELVGEA